MTPWIEKLNEQFDRFGVYPDIEACTVNDIRDAWALSDTQESTVFSSPEGCWRALTLLPDDSTIDDIWDALRPNQRDDEVVWWGAGYRQDPQATTEED